MDHAILLGDVLEVCRDLPDNSCDACLCDPPYVAIAEARIAHWEVE